MHHGAVMMSSIHLLTGMPWWLLAITSDWTIAGSGTCPGSAACSIRCSYRWLGHLCANQTSSIQLYPQDLRVGTTHGTVHLAGSAGSAIQSCSTESVDKRFLRAEAVPPSWMKRCAGVFSVGNGQVERLQAGASTFMHV